MRVLIVDDEQPARERLRTMLERFPDVEVVGEAADGEEALERIRGTGPDLVLLDVQMPGCTGIDLAASLETPRPKIIFCTAYEQYAVDAFELAAVDYLLKPVSRARLSHALDRVRSIPAEEASERVDRALRTTGGLPQRVLARVGSRCIVVPQRDILYFGSDGGLTKLYTANHHYVMDPTLNDFERRLSPAAFFRLSRTALVNLDWVTTVDTLPGGFGEVTLRNGTRLEVSRRRLKDLMDGLEGKRSETSESLR